MAQDTVDAAIMCAPSMPVKKLPSIEALSSEMPCREFRKDGGRRILRSLLNRLRLRKAASADISEPDPSYKVAYLGNVVTGWAKGAGCVEKPLATLWRNYTQSSRPDVCMQLTVSGGGLKATTKDHGLTEYWAHRLTTCAAPAQFPRLFCWVYRHEGRRLRHELRCHAVLCPTTSVARQIEAQLKHSLTLALAEFKRDKISRQNARLSLVNCVYENPTIPRRKILLSTGSNNYRPPLERSKSAPKLTSIEENLEEEEEIFEGRPRNIFRSRLLKHSDSTGVLLDKRKALLMKLNAPYYSCHSIAPALERINDEDEETYDRVNYNDEDNLLDDKSTLILEELAQDSLRHDLIESCEQGWLATLEGPPDLHPQDSDEGSLSSGCESASTITSDADYKPEESSCCAKPEKRKTEFEFKVGECVMSRVCSLERLANVRKSNGLKTNLLESEEVSLVPVGETQQDFSSLKVYKKRAEQEHLRVLECGGECDGSEEENGSACSDESGYDETLDGPSTVSNIILV